ncbi:MAG TPA: pitrilysin family protein [Longimicrobiales bacterium]|nr:pitrilysin family protein [Longimicrobiales bacterium]
MRRTHARRHPAPAALLVCGIVAAACGSPPEPAPPAPGDDVTTTDIRTTPPVAGPPPELSLPNPVRSTLANGLEVILVEQHELPVVDLRLVVRTGAAADAPADAGRATLLADLLDEGTTTRTSLQIADELEFLGAELHTDASWDASLVTLHVLRPRLDAALELMSDVVLHATFPDEELERKRAERLATLIQQRDEPRFLASDAFNSVLYGPEHPYGISTLGTDASVRALTREELLRTYRRFWRPGNAFLVVAGAITMNELLPMLERHFAEWENAEVGQPPLPSSPPPGVTAIHIVDKPAAAQSEIRVGQIGVARDTPDYFPLLVMNTMLGGSFTSRLNMNLREDKGYTYGARSGFDQRMAAGPFTAAAAVHTAVTDSAVIEFIREMRRIRDERVPPAELDRAKNYIAYGLTRRFETTDDIASNLADAELYSLGTDWFDRYVARVRAVTAEDVQRVANRYLDPSQWAIVIAGDRTAIEPKLRALGLGDIVIRPAGNVAE